MIITEQDFRKAERYVRSIGEAHRQGKLAEIAAEEFVAENPHLLMPLSFDDYYGIDWNMAEDYERARPQVLASSSAAVDLYEEYGQHVRQAFGLADLWFSGQESLYRDLRGGTWFWFEGITDDGKLHFVGPKANPNHYVPIDTWLDLLEKSVSKYRDSSCRFWLPQVFSPRVQIQRTEALSKAIQPILTAIKGEKKSLQEISWRSLEEIVAELLRAQGFKIELTPKTRDGGRDIVAKCNLGMEPATIIAVEVKQKSVVSLADVRNALTANQDFPALMIVTSGRFSSGVIHEKNKDRNQFRLYLKDGIGLSQWIDSYKT